jgi:predicted PurR-regulated permease PerM
MLVTMAVLFHEGPGLLSTLRRFLPLPEGDRDEVIRELREVTRSVFFGVILTALVQGVLGGIGVAIVGLPNPIVFGGAMFLCAILPAGTVIVWLPAALWLLATGSPWRGIFLIAWGAGVVSTADNFLRPLFIGRGVRMHALLVFFGTLGGMLAFGIIGLFLGPLIITVFLFLLEVLRRDFFAVEAETARPPKE